MHKRVDTIDHKTIQIVVLPGGMEGKCFLCTITRTRSHTHKIASTSPSHKCLSVSLLVRAQFQVSISIELFTRTRLCNQNPFGWIFFAAFSYSLSRNSLASNPKQCALFLTYLFCSCIPGAKERAPGSTRAQG